MHHVQRFLNLFPVSGSSYIYQSLDWNDWPLSYEVCSPFTILAVPALAKILAFVESIAISFHLPACLEAIGTVLVPYRYPESHC